MKPKRVTYSQAARLHRNCLYYAVCKPNFDPSDRRAIWDIDGKLYSTPMSFSRDYRNFVF